MQDFYSFLPLFIFLIPSPTTTVRSSSGSRTGALVCWVSTVCFLHRWRKFLISVPKKRLVCVGWILWWAACRRVGTPKRHARLIRNGRYWSTSQAFVWLRNVSGEPQLNCLGQWRGLWEVVWEKKGNESTGMWKIDSSNGELHKVFVVKWATWILTTLSPRFSPFTPSPLPRHFTNFSMINGELGLF